MACPRCMEASGLCQECEEYFYGENNMPVENVDLNVFQYGDTCYTKAQVKGEKTFTLRAQDIFAPKIICEWIKEGMLGGVPDDKLREAFECALTMRNNAWRKVPD
jgi:hypothetical protein